MWIYVCMYLCMYIHSYVCENVYIYVCMYMCVCLCVYICVGIWMYGVCSSQCSTTGVSKAVVCVSLHIKEPLLLIGKTSPCGGSGFPLSLSEWSFTVMPYNRK